MDHQSIVIQSRDIGGVTVRVTPGHYATSHAHTNYYIDLTEMKVRHRMAKLAASALAHGYVATTIDTIVCQEGTEMIGAFMADELSQSGMRVMNAGADICVLRPEVYGGNQLIFRENTLQLVRGSNVLLLISTMSTGKTVERALSCISYYGGRLAGVGALFSVVQEVSGVKVSTIFTADDVVGYQTYPPDHCRLCAEHTPIDAIVNEFGYSKL